MIEMLRIDDRLIHGQIAVSWTKYLGVDSILVANDEAAADPIMKASLKMACPPELKLAVCSLTDAIALLGNEKLKKRKILVIVNQLNDAYFLASQRKDIALINIGNYGRNSLHHADERKAYYEGLLLSDEEAQCLMKLSELGIPCNVQMIPERESIPLKRILSKK